MEYLKIKSNEHAVHIIFKCFGEYFKFTLAIHPDKYVKTLTPSTKVVFQDYGIKYLYDKDTTFKLKEILANFDPEKESINYLMDILKVECDLKENKKRPWCSIWETICNCSKKIVSHFIPIKKSNPRPLLLTANYNYTKNRHKPHIAPMKMKVLQAILSW